MGECISLCTYGLHSLYPTVSAVSQHMADGISQSGNESERRSASLSFCLLF
jgi:hypothetical protein